MQHLRILARCPPLDTLGGCGHLWPDPSWRLLTVDPNVVNALSLIQV
jgi:hypothetical protein